MSLVVCCNAVLLHSDLPVNVESVETEQSTALTTPLAMTRARDLARNIHYVTQRFQSIHSSLLSMVQLIFSFPS